MTQLEHFLKKLLREREELDCVIKRVQIEINDCASSEGSTAKPTREPIPKLAERILAPCSSGLSVPNLIAELTKLGYETDSKNPANSINSTLHKAAKHGAPLVRVGHRWYHSNHAPKDLIAQQHLRAVS